MTEKIDLGKNPFGAFAGEETGAATPPASDALSDLMQGGESPVPGGTTAPKSASFATRDTKSDWDLAAPPPPFREAATEVAPQPERIEAAEPVASLDVSSAPTPSPAPAPAPAPAPQAKVAPAPAPHSAEPLLGVRPPEPIDQRKLWLLRILLISNLAMMLVMLLLPHPMETRTEYVTGSPTGEEGTRSARPLPPPGSGASHTTAEPYVQPPRSQSLGLPNDPLYEKALMQALDGDFAAASATLQAFLAAHPSLDPALERLIHAHLAYYLRKAGNLGESIEQETRARQMAGRAFLPEELLRAARDAELRGDGDAMRRAYAQFLLQEDQLPPALRALVQEAYLKLGDAYRLEAERAEKTPTDVDVRPDGRGSARK